MPGTARQFMDAMRSFLGVTENPLGSNRTRVGVEFGWNGVAWCGETISLACYKTGLDFWSASTDQMEARARAGYHGAKWLIAGASAREGDIAVWDFKGDGTANHVSAVEVARPDGTLVTIGGNENNQCQRAVRSRNHLRGFIRLPFATTAPPPPPSPAISPNHPTLSLGSMSIAVPEYEWKMNVVTGSRLDGRAPYGEQSKEACENFQRFFNLDIDGICGPKTWAALDYFYLLKMS